MMIKIILGGEPEVDPLMENEEDVNGMNYPRDETGKTILF